MLVLVVMFLLSGKDAMVSTTYPSGKPGIEAKTQYQKQEITAMLMFILFIIALGATATMALRKLR